MSVWPQLAQTHAWPPSASVRQSMTSPMTRSQAAVGRHRRRYSSACARKMSPMSKRGLAVGLLGGAHAAPPDGGASATTTGYPNTTPASVPSVSSGLWTLHTCRWLTCA